MLAILINSAAEESKTGKRKNISIITRIAMKPVKNLTWLSFR